MQTDESQNNTHPPEKPKQPVMSFNLPDLWERYRLRVESCDIFDSLIAGERFRSGLLPGISPIDYLGKALWVTFVLVVLSGIGLLMGYSPTITGAFSSVENIQTSFPFGWWFRGVHKYGTDLMVILAVLRVIRILYRRAYKAPRELTWFASIGVFLISIAAGVTGYFLLWPQRAFWTVGELFPSSGSFGNSVQFAGIAMFQGEITHRVLTGIYIVHIGLGLILMIAALCWRIMPRSQMFKQRHFNPSTPLPLILWILGVLTLIALILPPPMGSSIDTILKPHPILSDWYSHAFYQLGQIVSQPSALLISLVILLFAVFLPWIDRSRSLGPRPLITAFIVSGIISWLILTGNSIWWALSGITISVLLLLTWIVAVIFGLLAELSRSGTSDDQGSGVSDA